MSDRTKELKEGTEKALGKLRRESGRSCFREPIEIIQLLAFRSYVQEAHLYALIEQIETGKIDHNEMQARFIDHASRIADDLEARRTMNVIDKGFLKGRPN